MGEVAVPLATGLARRRFQHPHRWTSDPPVVAAGGGTVRRPRRLTPAACIHTAGNTDTSQLDPSAVSGCALNFCRLGQRGETAVKTLIAVVGGSALVVMGAASIAMAHGQDQPTQMISSGTMNMGPTSTI